MDYMGLDMLHLEPFISTMSRLTPGLEKTEPYVWFVVGVTGIPSVFFGIGLVVKLEMILDFF